MSLYLSVDFYKHAAQTHPDGTGERVLEVTDALNPVSYTHLTLPTTLTV